MRKFLPFIAYAFLILFVFRDVLLPPEGKILFGSDITRYHYFQRGFLGQALREGQIPWWNPYTFAGTPYLEHPQVPVWYPPNLLFVWLPVNMAISWYIVLHLFLAMAGMYVLTRSWAAGVAFGFSAFFVARIPAGHIDIIAVSSWAPLVMWTFIRHGVILSALVLAMQLLAGQPTFAIFTLVAVAILAIVRSGIHGIFRLGIAVVLALGIAAVQLLPNAQYIARSIRTLPFPDSWAQLGTPTVGHLLEFLDPFYFYSKLPDSGFGFEHVGYIGKVPLFFAFVAVVLLRRKVLAYGLIALFGVWMWLGNNAPVDLFSWVRSWFPLYSQIRIPARHVMLFVLSASVLSGFGLSLVKEKMIQFLLVLLVLADLVPFAFRHLTLTSVPEAVEDTALIATLTNDRDLARFLPNYYHGDPLRETLEFNAPIAHGIFSLSGYDTPPLRNYYEFLLAVNGYQWNDVLQYTESTPPFRALTSGYFNILNVKYILVPAARDTINGINSRQFVMAAQNANRAWRLYENTKALPRFFLATDIEVVPNRQAALSRLSGGTAKPEARVIIDSSVVDVSRFSLDCPNDATIGTVTVKRYVYGRVSLTADTSCNAFLATSEVMYPGWRASIDGKPAAVFEGNGAFRTLYVPKGTREIELYYRPTIVAAGAAISVATIFFIAILSAIGKRLSGKFRTSQDFSFSV